MAKLLGPQNLSEAFRLIGEEVSNKSTRPNIYGYKPHFKQNPFHSHGFSTPSKDYVGIDHAIEQICFKELLKKIRLYVGGNRSGKTVGGIVEDIWWVTKTHPYIDIDAIWPEPIRGRIVTTNFKDGWDKTIRPELARWIPVSYLRGNSWTTAWDKETKTLYFADRFDKAKGKFIRGGFIEIMTHEQDLEVFAGTSRHFIHLDEESSEDIYKECMLRLVDTGGCMWITMTPLDGMTWTYDQIYEVGTDRDIDDAAGKQILVIEVDMHDNPFIGPEEKESIAALMDQDDIKARVHGKFVRKGGLIYPDFSDDSEKSVHNLCHVIESFMPSKEYLWITSMDHGLKNPTAFLWHAVNFEGRVYTFYEHYKNNLVISEHAAIVHEINAKLNKIPDYYVGDPSIRNQQPNTGVSIFEEYVKYGIIIRHDNHLNDVKAGIERVNRYLRTVDRESDGSQVPYWLITRNCPNLIWELKRYRWKTYVNRRTETDNNPPETPLKKDDHACDSCRYMFMSRPDLKQILQKDDPAFDPQEILNGSSNYPIGDIRGDIDSYFNKPDTVWSTEDWVKEEAAESEREYAGQTKWHSEDMGEW